MTSGTPELNKYNKRIEDLIEDAEIEAELEAESRVRSKNTRLLLISLIGFACLIMVYLGVNSSSNRILPGKKSQNAPKLAGQFDWYILSQLEAMKAGKRVNKVMQPYIKKLSSEDFKDLAAYIVKYSW